VIRAELPGRPGQPGRNDDVKLNTQALEKIERSLRLIGIAPERFEWSPRHPELPSPYPGLEAFTENDAGVFFGRESRLAEALGTIDGLRRRDGRAFSRSSRHRASASLPFCELSLQLARNHPWRQRGGSNAPVGPSANERSLERLEAENAQLRGRVVELMLQIQALRDGAGN
jgi:hypothetical protein